MIPPLVQWLLPAFGLACAMAYAVKPTARLARRSIAAISIGLVAFAIVPVLSLFERRVALDRASLVAASIAEAVNCAVAFLLYATLWLVPMLVGRWRRLRRAS